MGSCSSKFTSLADPSPSVAVLAARLRQQATAPNTGTPSQRTQQLAALAVTLRGHPAAARPAPLPGKRQLHWQSALHWHTRSRFRVTPRVTGRALQRPACCARWRAWQLLRTAPASQCWLWSARREQNARSQQAASQLPCHGLAATSSVEKFSCAVLCPFEKRRSEGGPWGQSPQMESQCWLPSGKMESQAGCLVGRRTTKVLNRQLQSSLDCDVSASCEPCSHRRQHYAQDHTDHLVGEKWRAWQLHMTGCL